jgi:hypothetical protein
VLAPGAENDIAPPIARRGRGREAALDGLRSQVKASGGQE